MVLPYDYTPRVVIAQYEKHYSQIFAAIEEMTAAAGDGDGGYNRPERPEIIDIANKIEEQLDRLDDIIERIRNE